jgi:hypothetical protein
MLKHSAGGNSMDQALVMNSILPERTLKDAVDDAAKAFNSGDYGEG